MSSFIKKHKFDIILIGAIILIASVAILVFSFFRTEGAYAVVTVNGKPKAEYPLNENREVRLENGDEYNILIIEAGTARIEEASCPDKLCVNQHKAQYNGETLVCLPNKTIVKIVSETESEIDFVS